jgi:hypothetical protein
MEPALFSRNRAPRGLERCRTCGEFFGVTLEKYLARNPYVVSETDYDPERRLRARCRCDGPLCQGCRVNRILRPMSGHYHEDINRILYVPHFMVWASCDSCASRKRQEALRTILASARSAGKGISTAKP